MEPYLPFNIHNHDLRPFKIFGTCLLRRVQLGTCTTLVQLLHGTSSGTTGTGTTLVQNKKTLT